MNILDNIRCAIKCFHNLQRLDRDPLAFTRPMSHQPLEEDPWAEYREYIQQEKVAYQEDCEAEALEEEAIYEAQVASGALNTEVPPDDGTLHPVAPWVEEWDAEAQSFETRAQSNVAWARIDAKLDRLTRGDIPF